MLLALDTATATASLALYDLTANDLLAEMTWQARRRHTQDLIPAVQHLLQLGSAQASDLTALAVTTGPGSFTGVRIAISTAKGIGLGLPQLPLIVGLPTLCVTAAPWLGMASRMPGGAQICACIQAGRGRYNWAWLDGADTLRRLTAADHSTGAAADLTADLAARGRQPVWLTGEIAPDLQAAAAHLDHVSIVDATSGLRRAGQLARVAALHLAAGNCDSLESLQPLYLRHP